MAVKIAGNNTYAAALGEPFQRHASYDGRFAKVTWYPGNGSTNNPPSVAYAENTDWNFGTPHAATTINMNRGKYVSISPRPRSIYMAPYFSQIGNTTAVFKSNDSLNASTVQGALTLNSVTNFPAICLDKDDYIWQAAIFTGNILGIRRANGTGLAAGWDAIHTLASLGTNGGAAQPIAYPNGDVGVFYTVGPAAGGPTTTLYYEHYTYGVGWGGATAIRTDLQWFNNISAAVSADGRAFCTYRDTADDLRYAARDAAGNFTFGLAADDLYGTIYYFCTGADTGRPCSIYCFYYDGTDIVHKVWDGSTLSGKTVAVAAPSLLVGNMSTTDGDPEVLPLVYHVTGGNIMMEPVSLAAIERSSLDGTLISKTGQPMFGTWVFEPQVGTYNGKTILSWFGRCHSMMSKMVDASNNDLIATSRIYPRSLWDAHNSMTDLINQTTGHATRAIGGRNYVSTEHIKVYRSKFPIDSVSFTTLNLEDTGVWEDISPTADSEATGRGYKSLFEDANALYMLYMTNTGTMKIRERRSAAWSAGTSIVSLNDAVNHQLYWIRPKMDSNGVIHLGWTYKDHTAQPSVIGGNILQYRAFYVAVRPNGDGTFTRLKADLTTEFATPCDEVSNFQAIYDDPATSWLHVWCSMGLLADNTPIYFGYKRQNISPYAVSGFYAWKWNGTNFTETLISSTATPFDPTSSTVYGDKLYVISEEIVNGVGELAIYSTTDGTTFEGPSYQTTGVDADNCFPMLSVKSASEQHILYHQRVHPDRSEILLSEITILQLLRRLKLIGSERFGSPIIR